VLGICRGAQLYNVAMGGTLIPDLETAGYASHKNGDAAEGSHGVTLEPGSLLHTTVGCTSGQVNTYHHQAADKVGRGLRVAARSDDGVIEALEWEQPEGRPFLLLVQWHPERLSDVHSPFAKILMERFGTEIKTTQRSINT
jgi:putative glutamine amidotransferase